MARYVLNTSIWFSNTRQLDLQRRTRLGTLGYLPWKVRRDIWALLIERAVNRPDVAGINDGNLLHYFASPPSIYKNFDDAYYSHKNSKVIEIERHDHSRVSSSFQFRDVSLTVAYEFGVMLFSTHILHFSCPHVLGKFIARLSPFQGRHFFHISINLFSQRECCQPDCFDHKGVNKVMTRGSSTSRSYLQG